MRKNILSVLIAVLALNTFFTIDLSAKTLSKSIQTANHHIVKQQTTQSQATYNIYECVIDGIERTYKLYLPKNIKPNAPLVFALHGYGGSFNFDNVGLNEVADRYGFALCYPQGSKDGRGNNCWNVGYPFQADMAVDDISFLCTLAKHLQKQHSLSRRNTFCTGMSNGGEMCYLLAYDKQNTFAAVAPPGHHRILSADVQGKRLAAPIPLPQRQCALHAGPSHRIHPGGKRQKGRRF